MIDWTFNHITVSRTYREAIKAIYPVLDKRKGYWELFEHLLFGNWRDKDTDTLVIPSHWCARFEGKHYSSNYSAHKFLMAFSQEVAPLVIIDHSLVEGKARRVEAVSWPSEVLELTWQEKRSFLPADRVWLATGNKYLREHEVAYRRATQAEALAMLEKAECTEAITLLSYLNNQPSNRYASLRKHLDEARDLAELECPNPDQQLRILKAIEAQAQPFYRAVDKTSRIFTINDTFLGLRKDVRRVITQDWVSYDLRSAQLAIVAKVWDIPELEAYLRAGKKIWPDLCEHMGIKFNEENKAVLKDALYAITFGAGNERLCLLVSGLDEAQGKAAYERFTTQPMIAAILAARTKQLKKIRDERGGVDVFGRKYEIQYAQMAGKPYRYDNSRSILALIAQSYELKLLYPVVQMAIESAEEWAITMWLHDGFCVDYRKATRAESWSKRFCKAVSAVAAEMGVYTELEVAV